MEGRAIARPNQHRERPDRPAELPSMEGRAIARPNHRQQPRRDRPCSPFNGGPSNCSAKPVGGDGVHGGGAPFNGGPSNCSAKLSLTVDSCWRCLTLQWRAEQLLGQTGGGALVGAHPRRPSMEGRAIARPNRCPSRPTGASRPTFNGGPSNCSAKLALAVVYYVLRLALQWRAEQLLGQTSGTAPRSTATPDPFNGGPSNCSAKPTAHRRGRRQNRTFNGGPSNCSAKRHQRSPAPSRP